MIMDALSHLLSLYPLRTALDVRCHFGAPWVLDEPAAAAGVAPYHLILNGTARLDYASQKDVPLQAGDIIVFPRGGAHRIHMGDGGAAAALHAQDNGDLPALKWNDGAGAVTDVLCGRFEFHGARGNALLDALPDVMLVRSAGSDDLAGLRSLLAMLKHETERVRPGASAVVAQLSSALFALLIRAWLEQASAMSGLFAVLAEPRLQAAVQGMLQAPEKPWSVADMAGACHLSRATFARLFRRTAAATPAALLTQTRMAQAALWLGESRRAVADIGEAVGYQSEAAFNRVFKRHFGVGPGQYRRQIGR
jgi:AraC family transcriptional activator of mtrCDE